MCSVATANHILEILEDMIQNQEVFTAFDVTVAVRAITSETVLHDDVRGVVDGQFISQQIAGYDRELCALNVSGNPQALVYFPDGKSAQDHSLVDGSTASVAPAASDGSDGSDGAVVDLDDDEYATTKEGRVQIPRKLLSQVNPVGGTYDVMISGSLKSASADARGDVRVSLRQYDITDEKVKLVVNVSNNTISIETV